MIKPLSTRL